MAKGKRKKMGTDAYNKARSRAHREMVKRLRNPQVGVKPPDPPAPDRAAPGDGVDGWRERE